MVLICHDHEVAVPQLLHIRIDLQDAHHPFAVSDNSFYVWSQACMPCQCVASNAYQALAAVK